MCHHPLHRSRACRLSNSASGLKQQRHWLMIGLLVLVTACSTSESSSGPDSSTVEGTEPGIRTPAATVEDLSDNKKSPSNSNTDVPTHPVPQALMQRLIESVATEAGVQASEVKLERAEGVTYRDGSLGCPEPNMGYTQAIVNGYWVVFRAGREEFDMRVTKRGNFLRCTSSTKRTPIPYDDT